VSEVLVRFPLDDAHTQWVVVAVPQEQAKAEGLELASRQGGEFVRDAKEKFDDATAIVTPVAESILGRLKTLVDPPKEIEVEFGLKLGFKTGAIIATCAAEGNFTIRLTWTRDDAEAPK
jgi:hypothetical protein